MAGVRRPGDGGQALWRLGRRRQDPRRLHWRADLFAPALRQTRLDPLAKRRRNDLSRLQALAATIRWAHKAIGKPIYVTENGIGTDDDTRRIAFIDQALDGVRDCLNEGIPVHSYLYWSLLDNFEWSSGYEKHFGLVGVDLKTFKRTPKPSAEYLGQRARRNLI